MRLVLLVASTYWATLCAHAFYLPGAAPHDYQLNEKVALFVNALTPKLLNGDDDKLYLLPKPLVQIKMLGDNRTCQILCTVEDVTGEEAKFMNDRIKEDYELNWLVDGLPAATMKTDTRNGDIFFDQGFNLGHYDAESQDPPNLNNHYDVMFKYGVFHSGDDTHARSDFADITNPLRTPSVSSAF
ncbi:hypothetical protein C0995_004036 [Termitomyces sp. Mi166|nr:hypothetical protein C0995_004036 [Termitomyces sp. Mi166\